MPGVIIILTVGGNLFLLLIALGLHAMLRSPLATAVPVAIMFVLTAFMIRTGNRLSDH